MNFLGITSIRQGANGRDTTAPNAANYDEAKVKPLEKLPDPLVLKNGKKITKEKQWWNERRPEIIGDFDKEILGRVPKGLPQVKWEVGEMIDMEIGGVTVLIKTIVGKIGDVKIELTLTTPIDAKGPVPVIMEFAWRGPNGQRPAGITPPSEPTWYEQVLAKGWGYAEIVPTSIQADNGEGPHKRNHWIRKQRRAS